MREIKTAVITGPTGAVGCALCRLLIAENIRVFAVVRPCSKRISALPDGVNIVECDLSDYLRLPSVIKNADAFFHLGWAGTFGPDRNDAYLQARNIRYTLDAAESAKKMNCKVFVGAGSQAEYGRTDAVLTPDTPTFPTTGYGIAKLCAGNLAKLICENGDMDFIWTRILSVYGPCDGKGSMISTVISDLLNCRKPKLTSAVQLWNYLYCDDAAAALYMTAKSGIKNKTYIVASNESRPLREYIEILRDKINPDLPLGFGEYTPDAPPVTLCADISELTEDIGFKPKITFADGIVRTINKIKEEMK